MMAVAAVVCAALVAATPGSAHKKHRRPAAVDAGRPAATDSGTDDDDTPNDASDAARGEKAEKPDKPDPEPRAKKADPEPPPETATAEPPAGDSGDAMHLALRSVRSDLPQLKAATLRKTLERSFRDALAARGLGERLVEPTSTDVDVAVDVHVEWINSRGNEQKFMFIFKLSAGEKRDRVGFQQQRAVLSILGAASMAQVVTRRARAMIEAVYTPPVERRDPEVGGKIPPGEEAPPTAFTGDAGTLPDGGSVLAPGEDHVSVNGRVYLPVRAEQQITVDGKLDEPVWSQAPRDDRFLSRLSEPHGLPTKEPTEVQVAYDDKNLYVAFRCRYSGPGPRDDSVPENEFWASVDSELVAVVIDPQHDHTNSYSFQTTRSGFRTDVQMAHNAEQLNYEWNGIWDTAVHTEEDEWTAELLIPWAPFTFAPPTTWAASASTSAARCRAKTRRRGRSYPRPSGPPRPRSAATWRASKTCTPTCGCWWCRTSPPRTRPSSARAACAASCTTTRASPSTRASTGR
ncbi:MAG: hypothetical protein IPJ65_20960 [Archangiaceae bacterium]|nr:hypothetical protein [Archangiaceae bacterium]